LRKRNRGDKHSISNRRRSAVAAKCSRLGSALKQNHTGSLDSASKAEDSVTYADYGVRSLTSSSQKMQKYRLETRGRPQIRGCDIAQPNENSNRLQSQVTDTEIYALGYCGYSTAVFVLLHAGLIKQEAVRDREALETQFANIMDGLLKPLPPDPMGKASGVRRFKILGSSHTRPCPFWSSPVKLFIPVGQYLSRVGAVW